MPTYLAGALLLLAVSVPFFAATYGTPHGFVFRGTFTPSGDESQYLTAVRLGMQGDWLWHDLYMVHAPPAIVMYPLYLATGHAGAVLGLSVAGSFTLVHVLTAALLFAAIWHLGATCLSRRGIPLFVAFALGTSGLYWVVALLAVAGWAPVPINHMGVPLLSGFTSLLMEAHEAIGTAGQLMVLTGLLRTVQNSKEDGSFDPRVLPQLSPVFARSGLVILRVNVGRSRPK